MLVGRDIAEVLKIFISYNQCIRSDSVRYSRPRVIQKLNEHLLKIAGQTQVILNDHEMMETLTRRIGELYRVSVAFLFYHKEQYVACVISKLCMIYPRSKFEAMLSKFGASNSWRDSFSTLKIWEENKEQNLKRKLTTTDRTGSTWNNTWSDFRFAHLPTSFYPCYFPVCHKGQFRSGINPSC